MCGRGRFCVLSGEPCALAPLQGGGHKTWKRRWFTLCNSCLYYFESAESTKPKGTIPLENLIVRSLPEHSRKASL